MKAIIPTGGRGTRMQPLTFTSNKHFIPLAGKPLIFYPIETLAECGIKDFCITYNPGYLEMVETLLGNGSQWGAKFTYVLQEEPIGLANIVQVCEEALAGESFVFHLGDNIFVNGIKELVDRFENGKSDALVSMMEVKDNHRLGVPFFDDKGNFKEYVEKPENPPNNFGIPGLYFFNSAVFKAFKGADAIKRSARREYEIGSLYNWLMAHNYKVDAMEYKGKWLDPGKFDDWIESNQYLLDRNVQTENFGEIDDISKLENRVYVGKGSKVVNSYIRGPVIIADNVLVKNAFIGPYTSVSDGCVIEGSRVENSVLMTEARIINVPEPIDRSLIGVQTEISKYTNSPVNTLELFVGDKCKISL